MNKATMTRNKTSGYTRIRDVWNKLKLLNARIYVRTVKLQAQPVLKYLTSICVARLHIDSKVFAMFA